MILIIIILAFLIYTLTFIVVPPKKQTYVSKLLRLSNIKEQTYIRSRIKKKTGREEEEKRKKKSKTGGREE